eukprot:CAMPEP_0196666588 /NCGR_PEP_ID=MMETSP1086-20130531/64595_1 /TAXON_ID=77921 /ORGANISM="Cyanoptyche  gloeocystis , Strain SAG4.97" /LENGTH=53 /DNA_ID=CAMNT_0042003799 /DNA_START=480 /DNA_END=641 /DNA_ORIENTATION=-
MAVKKKGGTDETKQTEKGGGLSLKHREGGGKAGPMRHMDGEMTCCSPEMEAAM